MIHSRAFKHVRNFFRRHNRHFKLGGQLVNFTVRCGKAGNYFGIGMLIELYPQLALVNKRGAEAVGLFTYCGNDLAVHHFNKRKRFNVQDF